MCRYIVLVVTIACKKDFRILRGTSAFIVDLVNIKTTRESTVLRETIQIQKRASIAVWRLANGNAYCTVPNMFAASEATVNDVLLQFL